MSNTEENNFEQIEIDPNNPPKVVCPKHGEVNSAYVFRVNMPEFGYEKKSYCLVCAVEYLSMVASEIEYQMPEEKKQ
jgi:hypothetical protein